MSQERLEDVARQIIDRISRRDLAALQAACDPEIDFTPRLAAVEGKTHRGYAGGRTTLLSWRAPGRAFHVTIEEFLPAGPGRLVLVLRVRALARGSHVPIDQRIYAPWEFRKGKALRGRTFPSRREALEAAGLRE
jgi:ketosteroid isomerase-like protein